MRKLATNLFVITTILFVVLYFFERKKCQKLELKLEQKELATKTAEQKLVTEKATRKTAEKAIKEYKSNIAKLKSSKEKLTEEVQQHTEKLEEITEASEENSAEKFASGLSEMLDSPEMQDMIRVQLENTLINPVFGTLIEEFGFSDIDSETFKTLLADRFMIGASTGMKMISSDKDQQAELKDQIKQEEEAVDSMIKEMLGQEDYNKYENYIDTIEDRMVCKQFNQQIAMSGENLLPGQNEQLIEIMQSEREKLKAEEDFPEMKDTNPFDWTEEETEKFLQQKQKLNENTLSKSSKILNKKQQTAFELFLENQLRVQEKQLIMTKGMFGKGKK